MKKLTLFTSLFVIFGSITANADEAKMLTAKESVEISAPAEKVWNALNNFGDLGAWHPAVKKTEIIDGMNNHVGAVRLLTLQDGGTIKEKLNAYNVSDKSFSYEILEGVLPVSSYKSTVSVLSTSPTTTKVTWSGNFKRKDTSDTPAKGAGDEDATATMSAVYKAGLENLKKITE